MCIKNINIYYFIVLFILVILLCYLIYYAIKQNEEDINKENSNLEFEKLLKKSLISRESVKGLRFINNNCFSNSTAQCLYHVPSIKKYYEGFPSNKETISSCIGDLIKKMTIKEEGEPIQDFMVRVYNACDSETFKIGKLGCPKEFVESILTKSIIEKYGANSPNFSISTYENINEFKKLEKKELVSLLLGEAKNNRDETVCMFSANIEFKETSSLNKNVSRFCGENKIIHHPKVLVIFNINYKSAPNNKQPIEEFLCLKYGEKLYTFNSCILNTNRNNPHYYAIVRTKEGLFEVDDFYVTKLESTNDKFITHTPVVLFYTRVD